MEDWLRSLGFHHGNPFATNEADRERTLLPSFFVDVDSYDLIQGNQTVIVFAPRGGGKSSLRVVLASNSAPWKPTANTLAVECTDFDLLIHHWQNNGPLTINEYVNWLIPTSLKALFESFFYRSYSDMRGVKSGYDRFPGLSRAKSLKPPVRMQFARLLHSCCPGWFNAETIGLLLVDSIVEFELNDWRGLAQAVCQYQLRDFLGDLNLLDDDLLALLADLNDFGGVTAVAPENSPRERLADFVALSKQVGFTAVHFLLDRLDETVETANNPQAQADILEPLLAHLSVLEMPSVAFKFFLSQETRDILWERRTVRQDDRLAEYAVTVHWDKTRLKQLLDERLRSYSSDPVTGSPAVHELEAICAESGGQLESNEGQSVGQKIERAMITRAQGSPRRLIITGRLLFEARLLRQKGPERLTWEDWLEVEQRLLQKMPLIMRLELETRQIILGDRVIRLTQNETALIAALAKADGVCSRDDLAKALKGASEAAIDQTVNRLRQKLKDNANNPAYLKTVRGQGFQLLNYTYDG
jgi:hypothetical protein